MAHIDLKKRYREHYSSPDQPTRKAFELVHVDLGLSLEIPLGEFYLSPSINMTLENDDAANNEFWAGVALSYDI